MVTKLKMVRGVTFNCPPILGDITLKLRDVVSLENEDHAAFLLDELVVTGSNDTFKRFETTDEEPTYVLGGRPTVMAASITEEAAETAETEVALEPVETGDLSDAELAAHLAGTGEGSDSADGADSDIETGTEELGGDAGEGEAEEDAESGAPAEEDVGTGEAETGETETPPVDAAPPKTTRRGGAVKKTSK